MPHPTQKAFTNSQKAFLINLTLAEIHTNLALALAASYITATVIDECKVIILDECAMIHRKSFVAFNKTQTQEINACSKQSIYLSGKQK